VTDEDLRERVAALETSVAEVRASLDQAVDRDIPLLKGTVRAAIDAEIDEIGDLPNAGHAFAEQLADYETRLAAVEQRLAAFGDVDTTADTKAEKMAAVLAFALNKHDDRSKVAVSPDEVRGCAGVSRRYAYELIDVMGDEVTGVTVREPQRVETSTGTKQKGKALLVDCEVVHSDHEGVNQFTTGGELNDRS
jgi:hypothetical protein